MATGLVVLALPVMLLTAVVVLVALGRPVLFRQRRIGRDGRPFLMWKFRTMRPDRRRAAVPVAVERRRCHKRDDDPRHTAVGTQLRRWRLDELPQLVNVLAGEMSLVGPRPELADVVAEYEAWQHRRHAVKPGMTGAWQVSRACAGLMHEHTEIDLDYVERVGFATDLRLLARTGACLVRGTGH